MNKVTLKPSSAVAEKNVDYHEGLDEVRHDEARTNIDYTDQDSYGYGGWANLFVMGN